MKFAEYDRYDALGLAELVRAGEVSAAELLDTALERAAAQNPAVNAIVTFMETRARAQLASGRSDGPIAGVPFLVKDLQEAVAGVPMSGGSAFCRDYVPNYDSEIVRRWRDAGLVAFGKTSSPEFGLVPTTEPVAFGPTRNPWNLAHTAGGSSGGSAAAVAAGIVPIASASDGGGSIRIPSSCCALVGLKPTRGRTPLGPRAGDPWFGNVVAHVVTRSVRDSAAALDATAGPDPGAFSTPPPSERPFLQEVGTPPGKLRIAFTRTPLIARAYDPRVLRALDETVRLLESLGHELVEAKPAVDGAAFAYALLIAIAAELAADVAYFERERKRRPRRGELELATRALRKIAHAVTAVELSEAIRTLRAQGRVVGTFMESYDVLLTPTLATPPPKLGVLPPSGAEARSLKVLLALPVAKAFVRSGGLQKTSAQIYEFIDGMPLANVTGAPSISLPLGWSDDGLPLGMALTGRFAGEATLLRLAAQLEEARPWFGRRPSL
ncbi:MAG: amidase [Candidatus Eremiobacteraeota bacterium]|nr:amidase [Candidatus Eremiobacteraeota bacterium]